MSFDLQDRVGHETLILNALSQLVFTLEISDEEQTLDHNGSCKRNIQKVIMNSSCNGLTAMYKHVSTNTLDLLNIPFLELHLASLIYELD